MSDAPKTDKEAVMAQDVAATDYVVPAEFARQFEREIATLKEALHEVVCGWHDIDSRIRWVEVQIDKTEMQRIYAMLGKQAPVFK